VESYEMRGRLLDGLTDLWDTVLVNVLLGTEPS
jgi:hypothetical protein